MIAIFDAGTPATSAGTALLVALVVLALVSYGRTPKDLFMLAAALGSAMTVITALIGRALFLHSRGGDEAPFFVLGTIIVAEIAGAAAWLRRMGRERGGEP
jgi:hypothetical protein